MEKVKFNRIIQKVQQSIIFDLCFKEDDPLTLEQVQLLSKELEFNSSVINLSIEYNDIGIDGIIAIAGMLETNAAIKSAKLIRLNPHDNFTGGYNAACAVARALSINNSLINFEFSWNEICIDGITKITEVLKTKPDLQFIIDESYQGINKLIAEVYYSRYTKNQTVCEGLCNSVKKIDSWYYNMQLKRNKNFFVSRDKINEQKRLTAIEEQVAKATDTRLEPIEFIYDAVKDICENSQSVIRSLEDHEQLLLMGRTPAWMAEACKIIGLKEGEKLISFNFSGKPFTEEIPTRRQILGMRAYLEKRGITIDDLNDLSKKYCIADVMFTGDSLRGLLALLAHWKYEINNNKMISSEDWSKVFEATSEYREMIQKVSRFLQLQQPQNAFHSKVILGGIRVDKVISWPDLCQSNLDHTFGIKYTCSDWDNPVKLQVAMDRPDQHAVVTREAFKFFLRS